MIKVTMLEWNRGEQEEVRMCLDAEVERFITRMQKDEAIREDLKFYHARGMPVYLVEPPYDIARLALKHNAKGAVLFVGRSYFLQVDIDEETGECLRRTFLEENFGSGGQWGFDRFNGRVEDYIHQRTVDTIITTNQRRELAFAVMAAQAGYQVRNAFGQEYPGIAGYQPSGS